MVTRFPLIEILRRYSDDYTSGQDVTVIPDVIDRSYRFTMSGRTLDYDGYVAMVDGAFDHFPDLELVAHDVFTNGERAAMRFSEHASSASHDMRRGVWQGISLYRWNGADKLTECLVEQNFYGRRVQLATDAPAILEAAMDGPWEVQPLPSNPANETVVRDWLLDWDGLSEPGFEVHDPDQILSVESTTIDDLFSAGDKVAFRLTWFGSFRGGLFGVEPERVGADVTMNATGIVHCHEGAPQTAWLVPDRFGLQSRLKR